MAYFGDAASNIGAFHESLNLASLWKLPVVFVCQNNLFGEHTRCENATSVDQISKRAASYSMPGVTVNGNDPYEMYAAARTAINRARDGEGPTLIEAMTFRFYGHVFGGDDAYMTNEEKAAATAKDPLLVYRAHLIAHTVASEAHLTALDTDIAAQIEDAIEFVLASEMPPIEELTRDVYAEAGAV